MANSDHESFSLFVYQIKTKPSKPASTKYIAPTSLHIFLFSWFILLSTMTQHQCLPALQGHTFLPLILLQTLLTFMLFYFSVTFKLPMFLFNISHSLFLRYDSLLVLPYHAFHQTLIWGYVAFDPSSKAFSLRLLIFSFYKFPENHLTSLSVLFTLPFYQKSRNSSYLCDP